MHPRPAQSGFSLVELAIVLVVLGLLTGGILSGQALIRAAELRAVPTEYSRWVTATRTFQDKYFGIPGDFRDATRFWGRQNANADCVTNSGAAVSANGACDGNGDGSPVWENSGGAGSVREMHQYWRHLALAGLVEGSFTGVSAGTGNSATVAPGTNSPLSRAGGSSGWGAGGNNCGFSTQCFYGPTHPIYRFYLTFGNGGVTGNLPMASALTAEEAWNIDTKIDDGMPATGSLVD